MLGSRFRAVLPLALLAAAAGCDSLPGPQPTPSNPPTATAQACLVVADTCTADATWEALPAALRRGDSLALLPVRISADLAGSARAASYVVAWQFSGRPVAQGQLTPDAGFTVTDTLAVPRGARGAYTVLVTPEGPDALLGNASRLRLTFGGQPLGPPALADLTFPAEPVKTPGTIEITARVTDPDGAVNISDVEARSDRLRIRLPLRDDGQGGDRTAGDGRFSVRVTIPDGFDVGDFPFRLTATDRDGLAADPLSFTVTLVE